MTIIFLFSSPFHFLVSFPPLPLFLFFQSLSFLPLTSPLRSSSSVSISPPSLSFPPFVPFALFVNFHIPLVFSILFSLCLPSFHSLLLVLLFIIITFLSSLCSSPSYSSSSRPFTLCVSHPQSLSSLIVLYSHSAFHQPYFSLLCLSPVLNVHLIFCFSFYAFLSFNRYLLVLILFLSFYFSSSILHPFL